MNTQSDSSQIPEKEILIALLAFIGLQMLGVIICSWIHQLQYSWIVSMMLLVLLGFWVISHIQSLPLAEKRLLVEPWTAPWPWVVVALLITQIITYRPMMHDSLSYRLPRIYLALQENHIARVHSTDSRMAQMPWGWECLALPLITLNLVKWSKLISLASWIITYHMLFRFSRIGGMGLSSSQWLALAFVTAPFFVLQAASTANDILAGTLLLTSASLILCFNKNPSSKIVLASLLALVMAANVKPQFLVLGIPWFMWWSFAPGQPWRQVHIVTLIVATPLFFAISPLPVLLHNYWETGSVTGTFIGSSNIPDASMWQMIFAGCIQFLVPNLQMPINPWATESTHIIQSIPIIKQLSHGIPKFNPNIEFIQTIDSGNIGIVHMCLVIIVICSATKKAKRATLLWLVGIALSFLIASSQVVVSSMARSFTPFIIALLPMAVMHGGNFFITGRKHLILVAISLFGLASLCLNPSAPLWPTKYVSRTSFVREHYSISSKLDHYLAYQKRAYTGAGMLEKVPAGEPVGVLIRQMTPVTNLWQPDWRSRKIKYIHDATPETFQRSTVQWLIIAEHFEDEYPKVFESYSKLDGWKVVHKETYLPNIRQGKERWILYKRSNDTD